MFPLYDETAPLLKTPYAVLALITSNVLIFFFTAFSNDFERIIFEYGAIPSKISAGQNLTTLLTSVFLHAGFIHLLGNMWFLWIFGRTLEGNLGIARFMFFYLLVGVIAGLIHVYAASPSFYSIPAIGASGAISGVLGAYLILFPKNKIRAFFAVIYGVYRFSLPAYIYFPIWFLYQLLFIGSPTTVAYAAHIGGFIAGMLLAAFFKKNIIRKDYVIVGGETIERKY